jgi:DNA-binding LacI/PurR family transcriptional regulator
MNRKTTILDVAARAGVGKSTAARALRGAAFVAETTRQQVLKAAEELNYRPDPAMRLLLQRRAGTTCEPSGMDIAFVATSKKHHAGLRKGFSRGASEKAGKLGYRLSMYFANEFSSGASLERALWTRGVRGLIMDVLYAGERRIELDWSRFAAVACGIGEVTYPLQTVDMDIPHAIRACIRKIVDAGHRRIAVSIFYGGDNEQELLREGALLYMKHHLPRGCKIETFSARAAQKDPQAFAQWIQQIKPDAVLGNHEGFFRYLQKNGIAVPQDISFVCLNNSSKTPKLTGMIYDSVTVGRAAVELLDAQIQGHQKGSDRTGTTLSIEPVWNTGFSLIPALHLRSKESARKTLKGT